MARRVRSLVPLCVAVAATAIAAGACAPRRALVVEPRLPAGLTLTYRFASEVSTTLLRSDERVISSTLEGTVSIAVLPSTSARTPLRIELTPTRSTRDGRVTEPGPSQRRRVLLLPNGTVRTPEREEPFFGEAELGSDLLATVLDPLVPTPLPEPGARWENAGGTGRLIALDRSSGHDLAHLELLGEREVARQRMLDGRPVDLTGIERTETVLRWDLDAGVADGAELRSRSEYLVRAGALVGGRIEVSARTSVELVEAGTAAQPS